MGLKVTGSFRLDPPQSAITRQDPPGPAISFGEKILTAFSAGWARGLISFLAFFAHAVVYSASFCGRVRRGERENDEVLPVAANDRQTLPDAARRCHYLSPISAKKA